MTELLQAVELFLSQDTPQETRQQVEGFLQQFPLNPEVLPQILQVIVFLQDPQNTDVRKDVMRQFMITRCLNTCLAACWRGAFHPSPAAPELRAMFLQIMTNEHVLLYRHNIVQALAVDRSDDPDRDDSVFGCEVGFMRWPELFEYVSALSSSQNWEDVEVAMYTITYLVPKLAPDTLMQYLMMFLQMAVAGMSSGQWEMAITGAGLLAVIACEIDDPSIILEPFQLMVTCFGNALQTGDADIITRFAEKVSHAFRGKLPMPPDQIISVLFSFVEINPGLAYIPIIALITFHGKDDMTPDLMAEIVKQTLPVATAIFQAEDDNTGLDVLEDTQYILSSVTEIATRMRKKGGKVLFRQMIELAGQTLQEVGPPTIIMAMALSNFIDECPDVVLANMASLSQFLLSVSEIPHFAAKECVVETIGNMAKMLEEGSNDTAVKFIDMMLVMFEGPSPGLMVKTMDALTKLLNCCDIAYRQIDPLMQRMVAVLQCPDFGRYVSNAIACLSALVFSAGEDIAPFVTALFPIFMDATKVSEEVDAVLKANVIEAMGNMIRFAGSTLGEMQLQAFQFILASGRTNDSEIRASVMSAISNTLVVELPGREAHAGDIKVLIDAYVADEDAETEDADDINMDDIADLANHPHTSAMINTCLLIKNLFKRRPELISPDLGRWPEFCMSCTEAFSDDLIVAAILALLYMTLKIPDALPQVLQHLMQKLESAICESATVVGVIFKAIATFMENGVPLPQEVIGPVMACAEQALMGSLKCQSDEATDEDKNGELNIMQNVYKFLACFATLAGYTEGTAPFWKKFVDHGRHLDGESPFEMSQYVGVLRQLYINHHDKFQTIMRKSIVKIFIESMEPVCDFSVIPEPILAVKNVFMMSRDDLTAANMQNILAFLWNLFDQENEGEMNYWSTMTAAVSFICTVYKSGIGIIEVDKWLPRILPVLPVKGDEIEAENIYSTITGIVQSLGESVAPLAPEISRIYIQTLGLKDDVFASLQLEATTVQAMIGQMAAMLPAESAGAIICECIPDEMSQRRFRNRTGQQ